jgi:hypothetical protein
MHQTPPDHLGLTPSGLTSFYREWSPTRAPTGPVSETCKVQLWLTCYGAWMFGLPSNRR